MTPTEKKITENAKKFLAYDELEEIETEIRDDLEREEAIDSYRNMLTQQIRKEIEARRR
ncbi:MAG: hypothetical protein ACJ74Z_12125 [Bryobacteraceae bacterium]|jgi:hypothetical protein